MKRFAIIGLGHFGANVARQLYKEGAEVIAVDVNKEAVQNAADFSDQAICASATERKVLEGIGITDVDCAVVSLGDSLDASTLVALYLKEFGVPYIAVKAISDDHEKILRAVGVQEVIHPERDTAQRLGMKLAHHNIENFLPLSKNYAVASLNTPPELFNRRVIEIESKDVQVVAIQKGEVLILVPKDEDIIERGDILILMGEARRIAGLADNFF